ncbi:unnamed protein product, partial [Staurois parvus]
HRWGTARERVGGASGRKATCGCHCWAPIIRALIIISALMIGADPRSDNCRFSAVLSSRSDSCRFSAALSSRCQIVRKVLPRTGQ